MQRVIAKYGLAAHLALLAVAPLFLFPFFVDAALMPVMLWLSLIGALWVLLSPSVFGGERLHDARARVSRDIFRDPLFWAMLVLMAVSGIRAYNDGIAMAYDAEASVWKLADPVFPMMPGSVGAAGRYPFAVMTALMVILMGLRHALGKAARMAFLLISSALAGAAALVSVYLVTQGDRAMLKLVECPPTVLEFFGTVFAVYFLCGMVALVAAFERKWNRVMPFMLLSIGANGLGAFAFAPSRVTVLFLGAGLLLLLYSMVFASRVLHSSAEFKVLVFFAITVAVGGALVSLLLPAPIVSARLSAFADRAFLTEDLGVLRDTLSKIALKSWTGHPWIGTGIGSFPFDIRFNAARGDWAVIPHGIAGVANGYWMILVERGIVGAVVGLLPFCFLLFSFVKGLVTGIRCLEWPHPACFLGLLAAVAVMVAGLYDCSFLRGDVLIILGSSLAVSAKSFPLKKRRENG